MTIPAHIVERAIDGGWDDLVHGDDNWQYRAALDPLFWQTLGKALGWVSVKHKHPDDCACGYTKCEMVETTVLHHWKQNALRFYDLILTGGDTEKFWDEILPSV